MNAIIDRIRRCEVCIDRLPLGPRPIVQFSALSKIIIIGQAPGKRVHETGIPWNDASGLRLREWMHIDEKTFYDPDLFSILPMSFCSPGKGISGDLPPRAECAPLWHPQAFKYLKRLPLIFLVGQYAQRYYLKKEFKGSLTETVKNYREYLPQYFPLPHPSPRNQNWVRVNPWFGEEIIPALQKIIKLEIDMEFL